MIKLGLWTVLAVLGTVIFITEVIGTGDALVIARAAGLVMSWVLPVVLLSLGVVWYLERGEDD